MLDALAEDGQDSHMLGADAPTASYRFLSTTPDDPEEAALELQEAPKYLLAKSFFDCKEFDRCAAVFLPQAIPAGGLAVFERPKGRTPTSTPAKGAGRKPETRSYPYLSQKSLFLALYARYIAGEKRKDEDSEVVLGQSDGGATVNRELPALTRGLELYFQSRDAKDPSLKRSQGWLEYLYGVVLARSKQEAEAQQWLLRAVRQNPFHWGAWDELSNLLASVDELTTHTTSGILPENIMSLIYSVYASVDLFSTTDAINTFTTLRQLLSIFPGSTFLQTQLALSHYHDKDFETSAGVFQELLFTHPYRLDALDHYSNILYVMTDRPKLAFLAHLATSVDKFRPETCCIVGNYYSLCSQHEKAVMYFRRALTLDRRFLSAWTLMGHEYIELKNTHAAIESYRRAVDVNRKDYRAWYGLGQAYEVLDMGFYALFYYQRAAGLRPYDAKMWQAVSSCYAKMDRVDQAIKALKRALVASTYFEPVETPQQSFKSSTSSVRPDKKKRQPRRLLDPDTLFAIASLYERVGNHEEAANYMDLTVAQETGVSAASISRAQRQISKRQRREARARALVEERQRRAMQQQMNNDVDNDQESDLDLGDGDTEILSSSSDDGASDDDRHDGSGGDGFGTGTTATTSKARLWLARWKFKLGDLDTAERLAEELCMDGYEVEEAKGLVREVRGRREAG